MLLISVSCCNRQVLDFLQLLYEAVFQEIPGSFEAVGGADFLSGVNGAGEVADGHFLYLDATAAYLGGYFGTELKAVALEVDGAQQGGAEHLVAGGLVGDVLAVEYVCEPGKETGAVVEGAVERAGVTLAEEARPVEHLQVVVDHFAEHGGNVVGIEFVVAVLYDDDVAADVLNGGANGHAFAAVAGVGDEAYVLVGVALDVTAGMEGGVIGRPVVYHNDLFLIVIRQDDRMKFVEYGGNSGSLVVGGHDD